MLIRSARVVDREELQELWGLVFDEEPGFLDMFFSLRFDPSHVFLIEEDGRIVSALHALPSRFLRADGDTSDATNIVGAATLAQYRRRGYMEALLKHVRKSGTTPVLLYPAVRAYYEKNGFCSCSVSTLYDLERSGGIQEDRCRPDETHSQPDEIFSNALLDRFDAAYVASITPKGGLLRDRDGWKLLLQGYAPSIVTEDGRRYGSAGFAYAFVVGDTAVETAAQDGPSAQALIDALTDRGVAKVRAMEASPVDTFLSASALPRSTMQEGMTFPALPGNPFIGEQY
ncbi:MAG: GNAT family N-acetyltransferase [Sphaerochaetaceae bacterium]|jgi:GNAT superfamily N-acetyltransferase